MPETSKPVEDNSHVNVAKEVRLTMDIFLRYLTRLGHTEMAMKETRTCLWNSFIRLRDHLDSEACKDPEFRDDFRFVIKEGIDNISLAFRHMWSYVLDFIKRSTLTGAPLEEMLAGIVKVAKALLQMSTSGDPYFSGLIDLENQAYRGTYFRVQHPMFPQILTILRQGQCSP